MTIKEACRLGVMQQMDQQKLNIEAAASQLQRSTRQLKRIRKRYLTCGVEGLISKSRGKRSGNAAPEKKKAEILKLIRGNYSDFGPTFASEKLKEHHHITISSETLRQWMIAEALWKSKKQKQRQVHQRRSRRSRFGEMLQGDGSHHDWFEGRGPKCCLLHFIDDATNETTAGYFVPTETEEGYLTILEKHLKKYGRPKSLYVDKHAVFRVNREELKKGTGITHFGKVLKGLDIELICAHSPQAKGRIERNNGILQDRLVKEMRLAGIKNIDEANAFLPVFLEGYNKRFRKEAASQEDAHRSMKAQDDLRRLFSRMETRKLSKDLSFQFQGVLYLVETKTTNRLRHAIVNIFWRGSEPIEVECQGRKLQYKKWEERVYEKPPILGSKELENIEKWINKRPHKPSKKHCWR